MGLETYKKKRDFGKTPEPELGVSFCEQVEKKFRGEVARRVKNKPIFVVQKHAARRLHHDLRLEIGGVLVSWAVPKDPGLADKQKLLAVQTEDHPIAYAWFEGDIPEGNYGAGKVEIFDRGTFEMLDYKKDKKIVFRLNGKKLKGEYVLIHFRPNEKNWLFFKKKTE